jgi:hypothetical protein
LVLRLKFVKKIKFKNFQKSLQLKYYYFDFPISTKILYKKILRVNSLAIKVSFKRLEVLFKIELQTLKISENL